jgi:hypothetical protein
MTKAAVKMHTLLGRGASSRWCGARQHDRRRDRSAHRTIFR